LGIGRNRACELLKTGTIKGFGIGSIWKISKTAVDKFIYEKSTKFNNVVIYLASKLVSTHKKRVPGHPETLSFS
jgi:hypothetical protein